MLDLALLRKQAAMGAPEDLTYVNLGLLDQAANEIEEGRKAQAELARMRAREGKTFGTSCPL